MFKDRCARRIDVEPFQLASNRIIRINAPEYHVGIGYRRSCVAKPVGDRPGVRACTFRSDVQQPALIDPSDRPAACPDGRDFDHGCSYHHPEVNRGLWRQHGLPVRNQRNIKAGSAHVACDDIWKACATGDVAGRDHPCRWPGQGCAHRQLAGRIHAHNPAI